MAVILELSKKLQLGWALQHEPPHLLPAADLIYGGRISRRALGNGENQMIIPDDIIKHCSQHPECKGCPLKTCVAPVSDHNFNNWLTDRIAVIRIVINNTAA